MADMTKEAFVLDSVHGSLTNIVAEFKVLTGMLEDLPKEVSCDSLLAREMICERSLRNAIEAFETSLEEIRGVFEEGKGEEETDPSLEKELDEIFLDDEDRETKKNDDSLLESAIASLRVLQELCKASLYEIQPEPGFAAATAFQDASKGIIDSVLSYLEAEAEDRNVDRIRAVHGKGIAETGNPDQAAQI